jgi:hypothetical protein
MVVGGCGATGSSAPAVTASPPSRLPSTTVTPTTVTPTIAAGTTAPVATTAPETTTAPTPTTVVARPTSREATPGAASGALIADWEAGKRSAAATVATAPAVAALFATAYKGEPLNNRGCSSSFQIVCSWGPYAGASSADALYEIAVAGAGRSWYVSSVVVES